ncbi:MAG: hypothetical protein WBV69_24905 [Candidatus Sulfotelmatobacter sp.]
MTDWVPSESVMSEERTSASATHQLAKAGIFRKHGYPSRSQIAAHIDQPMTNSILEERVEQMKAAERHADVEFRRFEAALLEGSNYLAALQWLLDRHQCAP